MTFTIDNDNDIRAHETEAQAEEAANTGAGTIVVRSEKELSKAAADGQPAVCWNCGTASRASRPSRTVSR
jgi:hypothetical protein